MSGTSWVDRGRLAALRLDRTAAVGLVVLAVVAAAVALLIATRSGHPTVTYTGDGSSAAGSGQAARVPAAASSSGVLASAPATVVVDVEGRVRRPGLVTVPTGSRVWDVVRAAGGFLRASDRPSLNLARVVTDGEQLVVGAAAGGQGAGPSGVGGAAAGAGVGGAPVDLNTADLAALESLPGVGPVLAQRILDHRVAQGPFRSVDELRDVSGIGDKKFADLAPHVRV